MSAKNSKKSIDQLTIKSFWQAGLRYRRRFLLSWLTAIASLGLGVVIPYYIGKILGSLANPGSDISPLIYGLIISCVLTLVFNRVAYDNFLKMQPELGAYMQTKALTALLRRGTSYHNNRVAGKLVSDAIDYPNACNKLADVVFTEILPFAAIIIFGVIVVAFNSLLLGFVLLIMVSVAIFMSWHFRHRMSPYRTRRQIATKDVTAQLADAIVNHQTVTAFGSEQHELALHKRLNNTLKAYRLHDWNELAKDGNYRLTGLLVFEIVFILVVVQQVRQNPALLATGIFAFSYTVTLTNRLFQIGTMMRTVEEALLQAMPITEMLQEQPEIKDIPKAPHLQVNAAAITFDDVNFEYQESSQKSQVFNHLSLDIRPGERIGLVGPSGGGKTTLTKLLLRFEDIQSGAITIDGQDISKVSQQSLRENIGYVSQEPLLFHRSVQDNIAYGRPTASLDEVMAAAKKAYALEFIAALPLGFDTIVGERGVKLSGGQRQRVAIARAILKDAPILVLDEATSALDSESEVYIQKALWELMQNRTAVVIAHRLSTIQRLDRIIVMNDGKIIEQGTHKQLIKAGGTYARLWSHQSGGFIED